MKSVNLTTSGNVASTGFGVAYVSVFGGSSTANSAYVKIIANSGGVQLLTGATSWSAVSDERLKDITGTYDNALEDIKQIKPVKFTWKENPEQSQVGVIAQSVVNVVPEAVSNITYTDDNVYLGVRYTELIPISIAAIQELGIKLQAAMDRITVLETQLASK